MGGGGGGESLLSRAPNKIQKKQEVKKSGGSHQWERKPASRRGRPLPNAGQEQAVGLRGPRREYPFREVPPAPHPLLYKSNNKGSGGGRGRGRLLPLQLQSLASGEESLDWASGGAPRVPDPRGPRRPLSEPPVINPCGVSLIYGPQFQRREAGAPGVRESGVGSPGLDSPSSARPHVDSFVRDLGQPSWARGRRRGLPGPFKSPRPAEQCVLPSPPPGPGAARLLPGPSLCCPPDGFCLAKPTRGPPLSAQALGERGQEAAQHWAGSARLPATGPLRSVRGGSGRIQKSPFRKAVKWK
ncbi:collagen alpha-1(I) chain-like [Choloepus didactylus]|uniref:collagen alpha-1(I) chain-like n=1 Tax=Choloepus didactylus TaxID=27675 RepID=UPI00189F059A|nr:collagen alpha-1(I) chain-like [Choloepus didactylus]